MFFRRKNAVNSQPENAEKKEELEEQEELETELSWTGFPAADKVIKDYIKKNAIQTSLPVPDSIKSAAMDSATCNGILPIPTIGQVNQPILAYYVASSSFIGYYACALIAQHWLIQKVLSLRVKDAVRKWYTLTNNSGEELTAAQIKFIETCDKEYRLRKNMTQAVFFNNVFGIRHILFKHKNPDFDYSQPFNPDAFGPGDYAGISQIDPYWITPEIDDDDLTDPTRINFYEPTYWIINGKRYHRSHFVILRGDEVADYLKPTYRYGGVPMAQKIYERVYASETTANEIPQLAKTKRMNVQKVDSSKVQANAQAFINRLNVMTQFRDNYGINVIDKNDEFQQIDTSLSDLDSIVMTNYQLVCVQADTPASRLLGTGHNGFSTGETDDDYYIQGLEETQGNVLNEIAEAHYARLIPSEIKPKLGIEPDLDIVWNPLKVMSANEIADVRLKNAQADSAWFQTGSIDNVDIRERLSKDEYSGFEGMAMPDSIVDDATAEDESIAMDADFEESQHDRDESGKFTSGGSSSGSVGGKKSDKKSSGNSNPKHMTANYTSEPLDKALSDAEADGYNTDEIYIHASRNDDDINEISGNGNFPGLFALGGEDADQASDYGDTKYQIVIKGNPVDNDEISDHISDNYGDFENFVKDETFYDAYEDEIDDPEEAMEHIQEIINGESLEETDDTMKILGASDTADFFKEAQSLRMKYATKMGASAVRMEDEFGTDTVAILPGNGAAIISKDSD